MPRKKSVLAQPCAVHVDNDLGDCFVDLGRGEFFPLQEANTSNQRVWIKFRFLQDHLRT